MKIIIDARFFGTETGIGRYVKEIVENLEGIDNGNQYVIFLSPKNWHLYNPKNQNFTKKQADISWYSMREQLFFGRLIDKERGDLCFFPHFNVPLFCGTPFVMTIHDLILRHFPTSRASTLGPIKFYIKYFFYNLILRRAVKRAKKIIVPSYFVRNGTLKEFGANPDKVRVVYEGLSKLPRETRLGADFLKDKGITLPYILYVGNCYPHKNLERFTEAFLELKKEEPDMQLVLAGKRDYFSQRLEREIKEKHPGFAKKYPEDIIFYGYAPDEELAVLYKHARLCAIPSFMEGFGLPPLEALSFGRPVACSDIPVFHEIVGDAVSYFDPHSPEDMEKVLKNIISKGEHGANAAALLARYDWKKAAEEHLDIFSKFNNLQLNSLSKNF